MESQTIRTNQVQVVQAADADQFKSRFGYHKCDRETFLKLKRLHKAFWENVRKCAANERWNAKTVHRKGPEPQFNPDFAVKKSYVFGYPTSRDVYSGIFRLTESHPIRKTFQEARMPSETPVVPFDAEKLKWIDSMILSLDNFGKQKLTIDATSTP